MENDYRDPYKNGCDETVEKYSNQIYCDSKFADYESESDTIICRHNCINAQLLGL